MKTVYVVTSLTHVKTNPEKEEIRSFLRWLKEKFGVIVLEWAFDVACWKPKPVDNIYDYDSSRVLAADLVIVLYLSNDGSDGRGGEVVLRTLVRDPIVAFKRKGVTASRFSTDCLKKSSVPVIEFSTFSKIEPVLRRALESVGVKETEHAGA